MAARVEKVPRIEGGRRTDIGRGAERHYGMDPTDPLYPSLPQAIATAWRRSRHSGDEGSLASVETGRETGARV